MTSLGRIIVTAGILIFTSSSLAWILTTNWQWFAGGGAIFAGTILTAIVLSVEPKSSPSHYSPPPPNGWERPNTPPPPPSPSPSLTTQTPPEHDPFQP